MSTYRKSLFASLLAFLVSIIYGLTSFSMIDDMTGPFSWPLFYFIMFGVAVSPSAFIASVFLLLIGLSQRASEKGPLREEILDRIYCFIHPALRWLDRSSK